jgi:phospholipid transport system substrate-binding protein
MEKFMLRYENKVLSAGCVGARTSARAQAAGFAAAAFSRRFGGRLRLALFALAAAGLAGTAPSGANAAHAQSQPGLAPLQLAQAGSTQDGAAQESPEALIERVGTEIIARIRDDKALREGDMQRVSALVDELVMPYVDFERMTRLAAGRWWREATPEQRERLMTEFRAMLLRTYSGALEQIGDQQIRMKPRRGQADATDLIVRSEILQPGREPIQLDYRMRKSDAGWQIYDLNVLGVWIVETYRNQFNQEASRGGVEGLIKSLGDRNREFGPQKGT